MLGNEIESGELPNDDGLVGGLIEDVSYRNAARYFGWE
jgi:glucuronate isomerase